MDINIKRALLNGLTHVTRKAGGLAYNSTSAPFPKHIACRFPFCLIEVFGRYLITLIYFRKGAN